MWPFDKKEAPKDAKPTGKSETQEDYAQAAREVVAEVVAEEPGARPEPGAEEVRQAPEAEVFVIEDEYARELVKFCFRPMGRRDPRWYVTDDEAGRASPRVRAAIQDLADRIIPAALARLAEKNKKVFEAVIAMGALVFFKYRQIARLEEQAEKRRASRAEEAKDERLRAAVDSKPVLCDHCQVVFDNMEKCAEHLPCSGPKGGTDGRAETES